MIGLPCTPEQVAIAERMRQNDARYAAAKRKADKENKK